MSRPGFRGGVGWVVVGCIAPFLIGGRAVAQAGSPGVIVGVVKDTETGKGISGAGVEETGTDIRVSTQTDGRYRLEIDPGTYELRAVAPFYRSRQIPNVVVTTGSETRIDIQLQAVAAGEIELLEVVAEAYGGSEASQLLDRKLAPTLSDNISAQMIKLSPDSDAAEIVQRVPAVTIQDDKYLNVRGLNERYTSALLNGSRLPSTDPLRRAVPLDLFPANFIESISVIKTYTPDLPGDFSGGLAGIKLKPYPEEFTFDLGVSTKANTQTTFQDFRTYQGAGAADWFGYGNDFRDLPGLIPNESPVPMRESGVQRFYASAFRDIYDTEPTTAAPGYNVAASVGGKLLDDLGAAVGVTYGTDWKSRDHEIANTFANGMDGPTPYDSFVYERSVFETTLGVISTAGYQIADDHDLTFRGLYNRESDDEVLAGTGTINNQDEPVRTRYLTYTTNELGWGQLGGADRFDWIQVDWRTALSRTEQDSPDNRYDVRNINSDGTTTWTNVANSGRRVYSNLKEYLTDSAIDLKVPFSIRSPFTETWSDASFKFGPAYSYRKREHNLRNFRFDAGSKIDRNLPTEQLLDPDNIFAPGGNTFREDTRPADSFKGSHEIAAFYGMFELPLLGGWEDQDGQLWHQLRLIGGVRTEYSYLAVDTATQTGQTANPILNDLDPLPGVNLVYSPIDDVNVRLAWSQAVARPEMRELSPVLFPVRGGFETIQGNPDLIPASIESYDARVEWFLGANEVLSFGVFYKDLQNPIEISLIPQGSGVTRTFVNADSGNLVGLEFEARLSAERLTDYLESTVAPRGTSRWVDDTLDQLVRFSLSTNVTYTDSTAKLGKDAQQVVTSNERPLAGQAPYVANVSADYTHEDWGTARLLFNTIGKRLTAVGNNQLPDIYEQPRNQLDFVYLTEINPFGTPLNAKFSVENILDDEYEFRQGDEITQRWKTGVTFSFGLSYSY